MAAPRAHSALAGAIAALAVGGRRALRGSGRWAAAAVAVALACTFLGYVVAGAIISADRSAHRVLGDTGASASAVTLSWNGAAAARVDRSARASLAATGATGARRGLLMVPMTFDRRLVRLAAGSPLRGAVHLVSGRLPSGRCRAARCEVVRVAGAPVPAVLADRGVKLVVTGTATVSDSALFSLTTSSADLAAATGPQKPALLLSADPAGVDALAAVATVFRTQTWSGRLPLGRLHSWQLDDALGRLGRVRQQIEARPETFTLTGPEQRIAAADASAARVPGRLMAAAAAGFASLLAFLVLASLPLRAGTLAETRRLARSGASAGQRLLAAAAETIVPAAAGLVLGAALAIAVIVARAHAADVSSGSVLSAASTDLWRGLALIAVAAWAVTVATATLPPSAVRGLAVGALIAVVAALAGLLAGNSGSFEMLPAAAIPLAVASAALATGLILPFVLRVLARTRLATRRTVGTALVELAREPAAACVLAAAVSAAVGVGGFAAAYRATVHESQRDQARQQVPAPAVVRAGPSLAPPLRTLTFIEWARRAGTELQPVVRQPATAFAGPSATDAALLGVPAASVPALLGGRARAAAQLLPAAWRAQPGARLPRSAQTLGLRASTAGDAVDLSATLRDPDGYATTTIRLGTVTRKPRWLVAPIPARSRGGRLEAISVARTVGETVTATHQLAEGGGGSQAGVGTLALVAARAGGRIALSGWRGRGALSGSLNRLDFHLDGTAPAVARPIAASDRQALPVLATRGLATDARISRGLVVDVAGVKLRTRVVGVVARVPSVHGGGPALVADTGALITALEAAAPGTAQVDALWAAQTSPRMTRLAARQGMTLSTRAEALARLRSQPVARELLRVTLLTALLAACLAAAALVLSTRSQLHDRSHTLLDLETQGVGPRALRANLRARAAMLAAIGASAGAVCALLLDRGLARATLAAFDAPPDPPIHSVVPVAATVAVAAIVGIVSAVAAGTAVVSAFRARVPRAPTAAELA